MEVKSGLNAKNEILIFPPWLIASALTAYLTEFMRYLAPDLGKHLVLSTTAWLIGIYASLRIMIWLSRKIRDNPGISKALWVIYTLAVIVSGSDLYLSLTRPRASIAGQIIQSAIPAPTLGIKVSAIPLEPDGVGSSTPISPNGRFRARFLAEDDHHLLIHSTDGNRLRMTEDIVRASNSEPTVIDFSFPTVNEKLRTLKPIFLGRNSYVIDGKNDAWILEIALKMRTESKYMDCRLLVRGHSSSTGTPEFNRWLSKKRAQEVGKTLMHYKVPPHRIVLDSVGADEPAVPGNNRAAHTLNRRVEFIVLPRSQYYEHRYREDGLQRSAGIDFLRRNLGPKNLMRFIEEKLSRLWNDA